MKGFLTVDGLLQFKMGQLLLAAWIGSKERSEMDSQGNKRGPE
jgi:hypothetical protein